MPGKRQRTDVLKENGKKHLSRLEEAQRRAVEVPSRSGSTGNKQIRAPEWLPEALRAEFNVLRGELVDRGLFEKIDRDTLAQYLMARRQWLQASHLLDDALNVGGAGELDEDGVALYTRTVKSLLSQCRALANDLGLTVTSRCRLVLPPKDDPENDEFTAYLKRMEALRRA